MTYTTAADARIDHLNEQAARRRLAAEKKARAELWRTVSLARTRGTCWGCIKGGDACGCAPRGDHGPAYRTDHSYNAGTDHAECCTPHN